MTGVSTRYLAVLGGLAILAPLVILVVRIVYAAPTQPRQELALDAVVMGVGTVGMVAFVAIHLRSAVRRPLVKMEEQLDAMLQGRLDGAGFEQGPTEIQSVARRITLVAQEMERRLQLVAMQSGVAAMGTVLLGVAHEVSNPLAHMRITADLQAQQAQKSGDAAMGKNAASMQRGLSRLEEVVKTLRQCGEGRGHHDVGRLVRGALIAAQRPLLHADVHVECDAVQMAYCQPGQVVHAFAAVLQNAGESGAHNVWVHAHDEDRAIVVEFVDDGPGLPPEIAAQASDPFVTTKAGHAGLGLSLARAELERQGGSLTLLGRQPSGTRVLARLPVGQPA